MLSILSYPVPQQILKSDSKIIIVPNLKYMVGQK